jgi:hypothetical protein
MKRRSGYNPKRRLAAVDEWPREHLINLAQQVRYGGNPEHKSKPADFDLQPPTNPRKGKTLCDKVRDFTKAEALALVREGFRRSMVSVQGTVGRKMYGRFWTKKLMKLNWRTANKACIMAMRCPPPTTSGT